MKTHRKRYLVIGLLACLCINNPALARETTDDDDTEGRLDIQMARGERFKKNGTSWWRFEFQAHESFRNRDLRPVGSEESYKALTFHFNTRPGGGFDRVVFLQSRRKGSTYQVFSRVTKGRSDTGGRWGSGTTLEGKAQVSRRGSSSIQIRFRESLLGLRAKHFEWAVRTANDTSTVTTSQISFDYAPEERLISERW